MQKSFTNRQRKNNRLLQKELSSYFLSLKRREVDLNAIITVTSVQVTADLMSAKIYLSIYPEQNSIRIVQNLKKNKATIRYELGKRLGSSARRVPDLTFYIDDSLSHIQNIEEALLSAKSPKLPEEFQS